MEQRQAHNPQPACWQALQQPAPGSQPTITFDELYRQFEMPATHAQLKALQIQCHTRQFERHIGWAIGG
jgi:hypothetical protein